MKIGLIHTPNALFSDNQNFGLRFPPVWAYTLSTLIQELGHKSCLYDLSVESMDDIEECDAYFFSGLNQDLPSINRASLLLKEKFSRSHFLGGPIAWSFHKAGELEKLQCIDHFCIGDGELLLEIIIGKLVSKKPIDKILEVETRFDLAKSMPMDANLVNETYGRYYGAVIEVSRGCPFLCEFCDIRIMPDNNKNHSRSIKSVIQDLETYRLNGIINIQLACDNFIGDYKYACELVDEILKYTQKHKWSPSFYTWLTINISSYPELMRKMRLAGFDNLFIGVESFDHNTLLETSKLQNTKGSIVEAIKNIQSYGFIVVAGLIFGFDSDERSSFQNTLDGIRESGLISGDASLLTALPGTPLYRRMKLSERLRNFNNDAFLGGYKYITNIKYLMPRDILINGYIDYSKSFLTGNFQYKRLLKFYSLLINSKNFVNVDRAGYTNPKVFIDKVIQNPRLLIYHLKRAIPLLSFERFGFLILATLYAIKIYFFKGIKFQYFVFWLFIWINSISKYGNINQKDFDIDDVGEDFDIRNIIPDLYLDSADEKIPRNKINAQYKSTVKQLRRVIEIKLTS